MHSLIFVLSNIFCTLFRSPMNCKDLISTFYHDSPCDTAMPHK